MSAFFERHSLKALGLLCILGVFAGIGISPAFYSPTDPMPQWVKIIGLSFLGVVGASQIWVGLHNNLHPCHRRRDKED